MPASKTVDKTEPKAGLYTTEFWLTVLTIISATVLVISNSLDASQWMIVVPAASGAYAVSRGIAKT